MTPGEFVTAVENLEFDDTFNPYRHYCTIHDVPDAPAIRRAILLEMLNAAYQTEVDSLWIGRDLGYRGGRRTGLALTDDVHVASHGMRWRLTIERATKGPLICERTASVIWRALTEIERPVFLWNVFPLHPYEKENPFSNRSHNCRERDAGASLLAELIEMLSPRLIVALGNEAMQVTQRVSGCSDVMQVRHPSYGGQVLFLSQVEDLYGVSVRGRQQNFLGNSASVCGIS